jgi:hypothetical protein
MAEVQYMHICDYACPAQGGKPCIIGIFDTITAPVFPVTHPYMMIAIQLRGQAHEAVTIKVEIERPIGGAVASLDAQIIISAEGGAFLALTLVGQQFPEPGRYSVNVLGNGRPLATETLRAQRVQIPGQQNPPQAPSIAH